MFDPFVVLGVREGMDDEAIRRRYLELIKEFSPEKDPEKFKAIRNAYECLRTENGRLDHELFQAGKHESSAAIIEELGCRTKRRRLSLGQMLELLDPS